MREDVYRMTILATRDLLDQLQAVHADLPAVFRILVRDRFRGFARERDFLLRGRASRDPHKLAFERAGEIDGRWAGGQQKRRSCTYLHFRQCREIHPVAGRGADQPRPAHVHFPDRHRHLLDGCDLLHHKPMGQRPLINQLHNPPIVRLEPDGAIRSARHVHTFTRAEKLKC